MIDIVLSIVLFAIAVDVLRKARRQSAVFAEYQQSRAALGLALLLPLAPVSLILLPRMLGWLPAIVIAAACCVPVGVLARIQIKRFEVSGTDKTEEAEEAAQRAVTGSVIGLVYVIAMGAWMAAVGSV